METIKSKPAWLFHYIINKIEFLIEILYMQKCT